MQDPSYTEIVCWARGQTCIQIRNEGKFEEFVLDKFFRHSHLSSFIRQLNLYGFRKIRCSHSLLFTHDLLEAGRRLEDILPKKRIAKSRLLPTPKLEEPSPTPQPPVKIEEPHAPR